MKSGEIGGALYVYMQDGLVSVHFEYMFLKYREHISGFVFSTCWLYS